MITHFSEDNQNSVVMALEAIDTESKVLSSETLKSLRIGPRESLKLVRQMIKLPVKLLREDFFEVTRVVRAPKESGLSVVDFCEIVKVSEFICSNWAIAMTSPKLIMIVKFAFSGADLLSQDQA